MRSEGERSPSEVTSVYQQFTGRILVERKSDLGEIGSSVERGNHFAADVVTDIDGLDVAAAAQVDHYFVCLGSDLAHLRIQLG